MKFSDIIKQASALLQERGRLSYRTLRMEFALDDEQLDVLKEQLIDIEELAIDKDRKMLVWAGDGERSPVQPQSPTPRQLHSAPPG